MPATFKMTVTAKGDPFLGDKARGFLARETFSGASVDEIAVKFCEWRDKTGFGSSQIGGMNTVRKDKKKVARISYNGRIWPVGE